MNCPIDGSVLTLSERSGIEIDYCPTCRGVWLDRGELDKILERATADGPAPVPAPPPQQSYPQVVAGSGPAPYIQHSGGSYGGHHGRQGGHGYGQKRRKHWLSEIFD